MARYLIENDVLEVFVLDEDDSSNQGLWIERIRNKLDGSFYSPTLYNSHWNYQGYRSRTHPLQWQTVDYPFSGQTSVSWGTADLDTNANFQNVTDALGIRDRVSRTVTMTWETGAFSAIVTMNLVIELLASHPDRVLIRTQYRWNPTGWASGSEAAWSFFWSGGNAMRFTLPANHKYFIAVNGGMATDDAATDLAGTFQTAHQLDPETDVSATLSRMAAFYPHHLTSAVSGFMGTSSLDCLMMHDDMSMRGCRIRDYIPTAGQIEIAHEQLTVGAASHWNNRLDQFNIWASANDTYVSVWKAKSANIGEEFGLQWRKWFHSSVAGKALMPARDRDRTDQYEAPYSIQVNNSGAPEIEKIAGTNAIGEIPEEMGLWFTFLAGKKIPVGCNFVTPHNENDDATDEEHHANIGNAVPNFHDLIVDSLKRQQFFARRSTDGLVPVIDASARRPAPYDGTDLWQTDGYGGGAGLPGGRVMNHDQPWDTGYQSHEQVFKIATTVGANSVYNGGADMTRIDLTAVFDATLRDFFTTYDKGAHSSHSQHHGIIHNITKATWHVLEREAASTQWDLGLLSVAGDVSASYVVFDSVEVFFIGEEPHPFESINPRAIIGGFDTGGSGDAGDYVSTCMCAACDVLFDGTLSTDQGVLSRFILRSLLWLWTEAADDEWCMGITFRLDVWKNLYCFVASHDVFSDTVVHERASVDPLVTYRAFMASLRSRAIADYQGNFPLDTGLLLYHDVGPADWLIGRTDGSSTGPYVNDLSTAAGSWGHSSFWETALGDWMKAGYQEGSAGSGHLTQLAGPAVHSTLETSNDRTAAFGQARQAIVADWIARKSITLGHGFAVAGGVMGPRSDGRNGYTIFSEPFWGLDTDTQLATTGIAHLVGRILQFQDLFSYPNFRARRMRSLALNSTPALTIPQVVNYGRSFDGLLGITEDGVLRPNVLHTVYQDHLNPRRMIAVFINDWKARVGDTFQFNPAWYTEFLPATAGWYKMTKYVFTAYGYTTEDLGHALNSTVLPMSMDGSEVWAITFDFESGLVFDYRYDDASGYTSVPLPTTQERYRIEDIQGDGERFQFGFRSDLPDEEIEITSMMMRVIPLGRSKTQG